jgi:hypothetical protein
MNVHDGFLCSARWHRRWRRASTPPSGDETRCLVAASERQHTDVLAGPQRSMDCEA